MERPGILLGTPARGLPVHMDAAGIGTLSARGSSNAAVESPLNWRMPEGDQTVWTREDWFRIPAPPPPS